MKTKTSILQNPLTAKSWRSCLQLLVALALLGWSAMAHAAPQTDTWTGGGADNNWNTALNWDTPVTINGDDLTFAVSPRPAPNNDFTGLQIDSITFNTNGYALSGNALTITNGITDNAGSNSCSIPLTLGASQTFQNTAGGITTIGGTIALGTNNLTIAGSGNVYFNGIISSTNGGTLTVNSGIARLGPSSGSTGNSFGTNTVALTITSTTSTYNTNITYITNLIVNGTPTGIVTNTVVTTNSVYTYVTNGIFSVLDVVTVNSGTLKLGGIASGIPTGASVGNVLVNGTLDVNGISPTINGLEGSGTVDSVTNTATSTFTMGNGDSNAVFSGVIQNTAGSVAVTKTGWGTETLNGPNSYSGPTIVNQGTLVVGASGSLGTYSQVLTIESGAILDVTALGVNGYYPQRPLNVAAGTPTKPYTNFWGSYNTSYPAFVVTPSTNYYTVTNVVTGVSTNYTTNVLSYAYSTNSIISVITNDINGNFSVLGGGSISPVTAVAPGIATWTINGSLTLDSSLTYPTIKPNQVNFLLNNTTTPGGGTNDLIVVNGTLYVGDELDFVVSPLTGTLAAGKYTLIESTNYVPTSPNDSAPANLVLIAPRGITGTFDTSSQPGNILLQITSFVASPASIVWAGTSTVNNWDTHVTRDWTNSGSLDYFYSQDNVIFNDTGFGTINLPIPVTPGSMTFNNNKTNYTFNASSTSFITGSGGLTLNGSGSVTLNNPNSFTGNVTINNGTLILGNYGGNGNEELYNGVAPGQLVMGGNSIFEINAALASVSSRASLAGLTLNPGANAQIFIPGRGSSDYALMTIGANINRSVGSSLYMNINMKGGQQNNGVYFTNTIPWINGLLGGGWAHVGSDWLAAATNFPGAAPASGFYNYTGYSNNTDVATTWLPTNNISVSNSTAAVTASATINTLKLSGPATVTISSGQTLTDLTGGLLVSSAGAGASTITGGTLKGAAGADLIVLQNYTASPLTIGSVIADNGSATALTLGGLGGTLILTNNNTYSGATYINAGSLQVGAGGTSGGIASSSSILDNGILTFNRSDSTSVGAVSGSGSLTQLGTGTLTLTANNTLQGLVTISAGTLQVGNGGAAGSISNAVGLVDNGTLVFNNSGTVSYPKVISGSGSLVQAGAGTLIIGTNETYSGNTIVSNGTVALMASGSISNTPAIMVGTGAAFDALAAGGLTLRSAAPAEILGGSGTVKGTVTTASGTKLTPGTNGVVGTLTFNNDLNLNGGSYVFDVSTGASDKILVGGTLNQNSGAVLLNVSGTLANGLYRLIYATNGLNGTVASSLTVAGFGQFGQLAKLTNSTANELDLLIVSGTNPTLTWQGDGSANLWDTTASSYWKDINGNPALYQNGDIVIFNDSGFNTPPVNLDVLVSPGIVTANLTIENYTMGINGGSGANKITGAGSLVKNGSGTLTLQTVNDYLGGTVINGGVIQLNGTGAATDDGMVGSGSVANNGTLIVNNANTETIAGDFTGNGSLVQQGVGKLILAGNNTAYSGPITVSNLLQVGNGASSGTLGTGTVTMTTNASVLFNLSSSLAVNANISGSGNVTNLGSGTITLNGTDTYAGSTAIPFGTIRVGSAGAIPATTAVILDDGIAPVGTLDLNGFNISVAGLGGTNTGANTASFTPSKILNNGTTTNTLTISGVVTNTFYGQIVDNNNSGSGKVALALLNGPRLTLQAYSTASSGTVAFPNTFSGGIIVSNAALQLGLNTGSTYLTGEGGAAAGTGPITLEGTNSGGVLYAHSSTGSVNDQATTALGIVNVPTGQTATIYGPPRSTLTTTLQGGGNLTYWTSYSRARWAGNLSAFTGTLTLADWTPPGGGAGGSLGIDGTAGLPNAAVVFQTTNISQLLVAGTVGGNVFPIGSLSGGDNTTTIGSANGGDAGASTIYAIGSLNTSTTFGGIIGTNGIVAEPNATSIRKVGTGTLTLTNNTLNYRGQTVVSNGTLAFAPAAGFITTIATNNYLAGTNITIVAPGILDVSSMGGTLYLGGHTGSAGGNSQTLFGNGTLNGSLVVTNSLVAPARRASDTNTYTGSGLTVNGGVTVKSGSTVLLTINRTSSPANDSLTAASIIYGGALVVTNLGDTAYANGSSNVFRLFKITGNNISGSFTNITLPTLPANELWVTNLTLDGSIALVNTTPGINTNPPAMQVSFNGTQLTLGWPSNLGWILQSQTNTLAVGLTTAANTWFDVAGSAAQTNAVITIDPANPAVFYRLRLP